MRNYLDDYINGENLTEHQLKYMWTNQLHMFAYEIKDDKNYERIKGGLALVQMTYGRCCWKDVFYILNKTGLTNWQKFKLKFQYLFL